MQENYLSGVKKLGKRSIRMNLKVLFFREDSTYFAYLPSLDLTGYGNNEDEAKSSLKIVLDEFLTYTLNKNTLFLELQRLGWKVKNKRKPMTAPKISDLINTNDQLKDIVNEKQYSTFNIPVNVPAFA